MYPDKYLTVRMSLLRKTFLLECERLFNFVKMIVIIYRCLVKMIMILSKAVEYGCDVVQRDVA